MIKETSDYRFNPAVTCGPYKFNKFENNMVKLDLNENYQGNFKGQKASIPHIIVQLVNRNICLLYTSPSPRDKRQSRMPSSA